jgi:hypothetical protein
VDLKKLLRDFLTDWALLLTAIGLLALGLWIVARTP